MTTVVEGQQNVLPLIVVFEMHAAVEVRLPVTSQPSFVVYAVVQEDEMPRDAQEILVTVAMELVQLLEEASLDRDND